MPGLLNSSAPWWQGLSLSGNQLGDFSVLGRGLTYDQTNHSDPREEFARAMGQGGLWDSGFTRGSGTYTGLSDSDYSGPQYSRDLQSMLDGYDFVTVGSRQGEGDNARHTVAIDKNTGQAVWGNTYNRDNWYNAPLQGAAVLGSAALLGGGMPNIFPGIGSYLPGAQMGAAEAAGSSVSMGESLGALPSSAGGGMEAGGAFSGGAGAGVTGTSTAGGSGGLLSGLRGIGGPIGSAANWLAQNPNTARQLFGLAGGLLSAAGGGGGGGGGGAPAGPNRRWTSPLQTGIMTQPQQSFVPTAVDFKGRW